MLPLCIFLNFFKCRIIREVVFPLLCSLSNGFFCYCRAGDLFSEHSSSETSGWSSGLSFQDIDNDHSDPQMCSTYASDIYVHLRMAEIKRRPTVTFMDTMQQDINPTMRGILIDWLVEVRYLRTPYFHF